MYCIDLEYERISCVGVINLVSSISKIPSFHNAPDSSGLLHGKFRKAGSPKLSSRWRVENMLVINPL
jgi:hypothetical protein